MAFKRHEKKLGKRAPSDKIRITYQNFTVRGKNKTFRIIALPHKILSELKLKPNDYVDFYIDDQIDDLFMMTKSKTKKGFRISNRKYKQGPGQQYIYMMVSLRESMSKYVPHEINDKNLVLYGNKTLN